MLQIRQLTVFGRRFAEISLYEVHAAIFLTHPVIMWSICGGFAND